VRHPSGLPAVEAAAMSFDRKSALAKLHVAKRQLALTEDSYRAILLRVAGVASAALATDAQLLALLAEMRRFGFRDAKRIDEQPKHVRKIWALWRELAPYLIDDSDAALFAFCQRQTGIARPEWLDGKRANQVIEGLKGWLAREQARTLA
jgi:hypothetical protein